MRKIFVMLLCVALAVALTACGDKTDKDDTMDVPPELPPPPPPPVVQETEEEVEPEPTAPAEEEVTEVDATQVFKGEVTGKATVELSNAKCDMEQKKLTFTLENQGIKKWQINQEVSFPPPSDLGQLKLILNNYEMNGRGKIYYTPEKVRMFGPNEKFSENCGGVEEVAPGESVTCTVFPIPIVGGSDHEQTTRFLVSTPGGSTMYTFQCGA